MPDVYSNEGMISIPLSSFALDIFIVAAIAVKRRNILRSANSLPGHWLDQGVSSQLDMQCRCLPSPKTEYDISRIHLFFVEESFWDEIFGVAVYSLISGHRPDIVSFQVIIKSECLYHILGITIVFFGIW